MIINGGSRSNWRFFASHLMKTTDNERVHVTEIRGLAADTVLEAFREMDALANGTRCKNFFYHANLNPREGETLTEAQWEKAIDGLEHSLGLVGCSRFVVEHEKEGRSHRHVIWSRIDPDSMTARPDSNNYRAHERTARALEEEFGHAAVAGVHDRVARERPPRRAKNWETFRGQGTDLDPEAIKREVTALWHQADSGKAFTASLADHGYQLCRGDRRDFCIVDKAGDIHSLARRVEGANAAAIRARMSDVDRASLPTAADVKPLAMAPAAALLEVPVPQPPSLAETYVPSEKTAFPGVENTAASAPVLSALECFASEVTETLHGNDGEPHFNDGFAWLDRSIAVLDGVANWVRGRWQDLVDHQRDQEHDAEGPDR